MDVHPDRFSLDHSIWARPGLVVWDPAGERALRSALYAQGIAGMPQQPEERWVQGTYAQLLAGGHRALASQLCAGLVHLTPGAQSGNWNQVGARRWRRSTKTELQQALQPLGFHDLPEHPPLDWIQSAGVRLAAMGRLDLARRVVAGFELDVPRPRVRRAWPRQAAGSGVLAASFLGMFLLMLFTLPGIVPNLLAAAALILMLGVGGFLRFFDGEMEPQAPVQRVVKPLATPPPAPQIQVIRPVPVVAPPETVVIASTQDQLQAAPAVKALYHELAQAIVQAESEHDAQWLYQARQARNEWLPQTVELHGRRQGTPDAPDFLSALASIRQIAVRSGTPAGQRDWETHLRFLTNTASDTAASAGNGELTLPEQT